MTHQFVDNAEFPTYRLPGAGPTSGLNMAIYVPPENYMSYTQSFYGVSIFVHGFNQFPLASDKVLVGQPGNDIQLAVIPSVLYSPSSVRELPVQLRNCYFEDEVS